MPDIDYNCVCDDTTNNRTLGSLRTELMTRMGYAAQVNNPPPGMTELLNSFLIEAQELLYWRYDVLRTERYFTWDMLTGVRLYDLTANRDTCTRKLDPRKITWVGISEGDGFWQPLHAGIEPILYYSESTSGRPSHYEIRQCIEVWPAPTDNSYQLRIKGYFDLEPFAADTDKTTIDDRLVFLLGLANAKAHYGKPDAQNYVAQMEAMMMGLVAGLHQTRRYIPGQDERADMIYTEPRPLEPFV